MFRLLHTYHQVKTEHILGTYVLFWPDDVCMAAETCCLDDNYRVLYNFWCCNVVFLDGNKILLCIIAQRDGLHTKEICSQSISARSMDHIKLENGNLG
jgi:hypothetical protein